MCTKQNYHTKTMTFWRRKATESPNNNDWFRIQAWVFCFIWNCNGKLSASKLISFQSNPPAPAADTQPTITNISEYRPDVPGISDRRTG